MTHDPLSSRHSGFTPTPNERLLHPTAKPQALVMVWGFTLVELLVSMFIVSIIITIGGALFIQALNLQRRAFNLQQAEENAGQILEAMAKEIRISQIDPGAENDCSATPPSTTLTMNRLGVDTIKYSLDDVNHTVLRKVGAADPAVMNSNTVEFTRLGFCITGATAADQKQPRVTIIASIKSGSAKEEATIDIQTTISQRLQSN